MMVKLIDHVCRCLINLKKLLRLLEKEYKEEIMNKKIDELMEKKIVKTIWQLIKFGIVGVSNTVISYVIYVILVFFGLHYTISNIIGFLISILNAYYWNKKLVFKKNESSSKESVKELVKVYASYTATLLISTLLLVLWVDKCGIDKNIAPLINFCITIPLNFILNKFWAFKEK